MCLATVILSWNSFSQTVTEVKDTSHIVLSTEVARMVAIDLVRGDAAIEQNGILLQKVSALDSLVVLQSDQIALLEDQDDTKEELLIAYRKSTEQNIKQIESLNKKIRVNSTMSTVFATTTGALAATLLVVLLVRK